MSSELIDNSVKSGGDLRVSGRCPVVAVVGGGFSGTLTAVQLLRRAAPGTRVLLIERSGDFGPGVAYGTPDDRHVLNVPAARMSACADEPDDLVGWAGVAPDAYLPRRVFGEYLRARLAAAAARSAARLERVTGEVRRIRPAPGALELVLDGGRHVACDRAVLALGALPAAAPCELPCDPRVVADPWRPGALAALADGLARRAGAPAHAVLIGSGPTAVDVALTLCAEAPGATVTLVSRHGRLPFAHLPGLREPAPPPILPAGPLRLRTLERVLRAHVAQAERAGYDWRDAVDGLRPLVPRLWAALPETDRRAFAEGGNRAWEIRRHRLAPAVAAELAGLRRAGRLRVVRGAVAGVDARLTVRSASGSALRADAVVACNGPGHDVRAAQPLVRGLLADGHASADALALGLRSAPDGALLDRRGRSDGRLWTLGALRRGELYESTAVRELRDQAAIVAAGVCASLAQPADAPVAVPA